MFFSFGSTLVVGLIITTYLSLLAMLKSTMNCMNDQIINRKE